MQHVLFTQHPAKALATLLVVVAAAAVARAPDSPALDATAVKVAVAAGVAVAAWVHPALGLIAAAAFAAAYFERNIRRISAAAARLPIEASAGERYDGRPTGAGTPLAELAAARPAPGAFDLDAATPPNEAPRSTEVPFGRGA